MLLAAIDAVGVADGDTLHIDRLALINELSATTGFAGVTGVLTCDEFGDCAAGEITIIFHEDSTNIEASKSNVIFSNTE